MRRAFTPCCPCLVVLACHWPAPGPSELGARASAAAALAADPCFREADDTAGAAPAASGLSVQEKLSKLLGATGR